MQIYVCSGKETHNNKTRYLLRDVRNNREEIIDGDKLKEAIRVKRVDVMNLTLTSDNRLVEASKDKIAKLSGILNAPSNIIKFIEPLDSVKEAAAEKLMDEIMKECIQEYVGIAGKYCKLGHFNTENNTCVLEFTLGVNSYILLGYDKIVYGDFKHGDNLGEICFDIAVQLRGISNRKASSKIGDGSLIKASESTIDSCLRIDYKIVNGNIEFYDNDVNTLKKNFGHYILKYVSMQLSSVCENNPDIANNTNVADYIKYDETRNEYIKAGGTIAATTLAGTLLVGGVVALCIATNPDILQTGLLAKIANVGTADQIFKTIMTYSGGLGAVTGLGASMKAVNDVGLTDDLKHKNKELKQLKEKRRKDWMGMLGK